MARSRDARTVEWYAPAERAILPLDAVHIPQRVARRLRSGRFEIRYDTAFEAVIRACAAPRRGDPDTWINDAIIAAYTELWRRGVAHSVEAWRDGKLVGGLYGLAIGGAFFAESMFHRAALGGTDASKVALAALVGHLRTRGYVLLDVQMVTPTSAQFGAIEIPRADFERRWAAARRLAITFGTPTPHPGGVLVSPGVGGRLR
jgi:leucyl/phenylalanyl-tRNA--protein transferase